MVNKIGILNILNVKCLTRSIAEFSAIFKVYFKPNKLYSVNIYSPLVVPTLFTCICFVEHKIRNVEELRHI